MKHPISRLLTPLVVAIALLTGCASGGSKIAHLESLLAASGFRVVPATTDDMAIHGTRRANFCFLIGSPPHQ